MSYEDNYDQTARWDAESVREAEQRTQHRSTRSSAAKTEEERAAPPLYAVARVRAHHVGDPRRCGLAAGERHVLFQQGTGRDDHRDHARRQPEHHRREAPRRGAH